jgi:two-component system LytT family sensor kinase
VIEEPTFLSANQFLWTTLIVKLAVMAVLATMLARFRQFRHILIFERRGWTDRLVFAMAIGLPLTAGVAARLLLNYNAADLTLEGAFLVGLIAGPYAGATVGLLVGVPALLAGEFIAIPFAVGCGFASGGLREACPKEDIWRFTPFVFIDLHTHLWKMLQRDRNHIGNWLCWSLLSRWSCFVRRSASDLANTGCSISTPRRHG